MSERCTPRMRRTGPQRGELGWLDPRTERRLSHSNGADEELSDEDNDDVGEALLMYPACV